MEDWSPWWFLFSLPLVFLFVALIICTKSLKLVMAFCEVFLWLVLSECVQSSCSLDHFGFNVCHTIACDFMTSMAEVSPVLFFFMYVQFSF